MLLLKREGALVTPPKVFRDVLVLPGLTMLRWKQINEGQAKRPVF